MTGLRILIVSKSIALSGLIHELLPGVQTIPASTTLEAQKYLRQQVFGLCIIQLPLPDEYGIRLARQCALRYPLGVLLLCKKEIYDQTVYQVKEDGIFVIGLPCNKEMIYQAVQCLEAGCLKMKKAEHEVQKLKKRLQDERIIYQAKLILMAKNHWSEETAHHYIEQTAMHAGLKKAVVAKKIVDEDGSIE